MPRRTPPVRTLVALAAVPLLAAGAVALPATPAAAAAGPSLTIDLAAPRHPISPEIYGINGAGEALAEELRLPVRRWGGNATTRYDFATDTTNRGADWFFENVPGSADPADLPNGSETDVFVEQDRRTGTDTILTVPLIGWKPKARDYSCGFSIAKYGPQRRNDAEWRPDCGDGVKPDGTFVTGNDPRDTSVEAGADYVTDWLEHLTGKYGTADGGGVRFYNLDNEPDIWHSTHRDVHPAGTSYDEIRDRTVEIAGAVKAADPAAQTLGPVGWGWNSLFMSGHDQETCNRLGGTCWSNPPDRAAHGGEPFGEWYLAQLRAYEQEHGVRLLDYFDNHWYPQGSGVAFGNGSDPATNALRLRSTRNLWDPAYVDESWINDTTRLVPRMKEMVAENYPGTKTAITEYNWGALDHINGALAQADVLGIFGREGLDLATLWAGPDADDPGAYAFRMFRDYDGQGGQFGNTSVKAVSGDQDKLSVYAAQTPGQPLTVVVVNKTGEDLNSAIRLAAGDLNSAVTAYQYSAADLDTITSTTFQTMPRPPCVDCGAVDPTLAGRFPANSITTFVADVARDTEPPTTPGPAEVRDVNSTGFTIDWPMSSDNVGVDEYEISLWNGKVEVGTVTSVSSIYRFTGLTRGEPYHFFIRAKDPAGNYSGERSGGPVKLPFSDDAPPTAPGTPVASALTPTSVTLTWPAGTDDVGVARYEVVMVVGDVVSRAGNTNGATTLTVTGLTPRRTYGFAVRALDTAGQSGPLSPFVDVTTPPAESAPCMAAYRVVSQWPGGFHAEVTVRNMGTTMMNAWTVSWTYTAGQRVDRVWNGTLTTGAAGAVSVHNVVWNGAIPPGRSTVFGMTGTWQGTNPAPAPTCASP
ncbi:glycoside hydrolase family 44 protein [Phytohabitans sp. LJ34]|uniref:glycoside hydrolase family 44 protein n=1 Tax=Phytohabitans sp. LJ34 TaxID=3452217 RepID=UPI003F8C1633